MPEIAELAKSARSSCKKCKEKIEKGALRLGKQYDDANGHTMTSWYHPQCWKPGKDLARVDEIVGWDTLDDEQRALVLSSAPKLAAGAPPPSASPQKTIAAMFGASPPAGGGAASSSTAAAPAPAPAPPPAAAADGGGEFARFVALCDRVASKGGSLDKTEAIKVHVVGLGAADEAYLTVKLLMPGKANDPRAYQLKDKSLIGTLSTALRCSEREMLSHHEGSSDVGLTAEHFYGRSSFVTAPAAATITLADVEGFLDRLADTGTNALALLREIVPRCTPPELRVLCRLISKDLRIATGAAGVVKALGGDGAYARYKAQPSRLRQLVAAARGEGGAAADDGDGSDGDGGGGGGSQGISVMHAFKPMLAGQCKSFDDPGKKYGKSFYIEVKYDGERVQLHMANGQVKCFARSLKPTDAHKVTGLAEAVPRAFPGASSLVIDGEVVMKDAGGGILAFGAQGKHEQQKYAAAIVRNSAQFSAII